MKNITGFKQEEDQIDGNLNRANQLNTGALLFAGVKPDQNLLWGHLPH